MTLAPAVCSAQQSSQGTQNMEERRTDCNAQASAQNLSGDPRKAFMSDCLSGESKAGSGTSTATNEKLQQSCNTTALSRQLKGDELKSFMAECLKGAVAPTK
jgi:hypothetical protein